MTRLDLQKLLEFTLGSRNVYFQPPENIKMNYPCIRYTLSTMPVRHANNMPYKLNERYEMTYIDEDPDNEMYTKLAKLPQCAMTRKYVYDGLHCYVYSIYI